MQKLIDILILQMFINARHLFFQFKGLNVTFKWTFKHVNLSQKKEEVVSKLPIYFTYVYSVLYSQVATDTN